MNWRAGARGQALVESSLLLCALVGGLVVGGAVLARVHPEWLTALDGRFRGYFFSLSLPFP